MHQDESPQPRDEILRSDTRGRVRPSPERRQQLLDELERSGLSAARFAELHGIKYQTLMGWRRKHRQRPVDPAQAFASKLGLQEVVIGEASQVPSTPLEVELAGEIRLKIATREQATLAADFIRQLQRRGSC